MKTYPVSLYYRLLLIFGTTFLLVVLVLSFTIRRALPTQKQEAIERIAKDSIVRSLGPNPTTKDIDALERKYGIAIERVENSLQVSSGTPFMYADAQFEIVTSGIVVALSLILLNSLLVRRVLSPIENVALVARQFSDGQLSARVEVGSNDEIGELAQSFNYLAERIQRQVESLKHMAVGLSHEIRSPLARMRVAIEGMPDPKLFELLRSQLSEIDEVTGVVLEREALNSGVSELKLESIDAADLLDQLNDYYGRFGRTIEYSINGEAELTADRRRIEMWFKNVLDNCFMHGADSAVHINFSSAANGTSIAIRNQLPKDRSPNAQSSVSPTKSYGLGLLLCEAIAHAHGGKHELVKNDDSVTTTLFLPTKTAE